MAGNSSKILLASLIVLASGPGQDLLNPAAEETKGPLDRINRRKHNVPAGRSFQGWARSMRTRRHQNR